MRTTCSLSLSLSPKQTCSKPQETAQPKKKSKTKTTVAVAEVFEESLSAGERSALKVRAEGEFAAEVERWTKAKKANETGDDRYMLQVLKSGTLADKVAAMTLLVQESPVHRLETLDALLALAKQARQTSKMAIESLKDLFSRDVLPGARRLRAALPTAKSAAQAPAKHLVLWCFEQRLAAKYAEFVGLVEGYTRRARVSTRRYFSQFLRSRWFESG